MDMDFAVPCPLVQTVLPRIRFLFVRPRVCSTLPSDPASRRRPCASLVLHLHQVAQGTFTPKTPDMPGTQDRPPAGRVAAALRAVLDSVRRQSKLASKVSRRGLAAAGGVWRGHGFTTRESRGEDNG